MLSTSRSRLQAASLDKFQRIAKGPAERGQGKKRQKSSKSVKKFFDTFRQFSGQGKKTSKIVKKRQKFFATFRAAPFFRPLLGASENYLDLWHFSPPEKGCNRPWKDGTGDFQITGLTKFGESLGGSQAPPSFWEVPGLPRKFPELPPGSFSATSPEVLSLWN